MNKLQYYNIRFSNGQFIIATSEEEARILTGNKSEMTSMNKYG